MAKIYTESCEKLNLYLKYYEEYDSYYRVPLESLVIAFIVQWTTFNIERTKNKRLSVKLCKHDKTKGEEHEAEFQLCKDAFQLLSVENMSIEDAEDTVRRCQLPTAVTEGRKLCVAGLCSVARAVLKHSKQFKNLLGFRGSCLSSCSEVSIWTRFCEIDIINCAKTFSGFGKWTVDIPIDISRFEAHLNQPLRTHNIGKLKHQLNQSLNNSLESKIKEPAHDFAEGSSLTLADLIIFVCVHTVFDRMPLRKFKVENHLPTVIKWYKEMYSLHEVIKAAEYCGLQPIIFGRIDEYQCNLGNVPSQSLYIRDPKRNKPIKIRRKQGQLNEALELIVSVGMEARIDERPEISWELKWEDLPPYVQPTCGDLPISRLDRKCHQLRNMALSVCSIARNNDVIVDFCSGGGHLGILLAHLLPKCHIIMIENKEESVRKILKRIEDLPNTTVYQSNVDYFHGIFNIGVALHACGTATDLVIQQCLTRGCAFVVCPCCYGSIRANENMTYPRSKQFINAGITSEEHCMIGHAADQTHENGHKNEQGKYCMNIIDTDRCLEAEEFNYSCRRFTMDPANCTLKNNVIIGIPSSHKAQDS
ncbi:hypothetical protein CHUAL_011808 [Chamberlinius hualienensis]